MIQSRQLLAITLLFAPCLGSERGGLDCHQWGQIGMALSLASCFSGVTLPVAVAMRDCLKGAAREIEEREVSFCG